MKSTVFTLILVACFLGSANGQETANIDMIDQLNSYRELLTTRKMTSYCTPDAEPSCYLAEAVQLILFGERKNATDLDTLLNIIPDDETLHWFILVGLQQLAMAAQNYRPLLPGDIDFIIQDLFRLANILNDKGSGGITWYDLKYYIKRFFNQPTFVKLLLFYFRNVPKNTQQYIADVYLGGVKDPQCKRAILTWFDAIKSPGKNLWALRMFDASGKPPTNLLAANTHWIGNWNSCHKVKYPNATSNATFRFSGKYCRAKIPADDSLLASAGDALAGVPGGGAGLVAIDLGLCVPNVCNAEDVGSVVQNFIRLMTIHQATSFKANQSVQCEKPATPNGAYYASLVIITILTAIVIIATLYDCFYRVFLVKPYATMSTLSTQNLHTICNFSSSREQPHGAHYENLNVTYYQFSNRLRLHGMAYPSQTQRDNVTTSRKRWYSHPIYKLHKVIIDLSAYTAMLKPMSNTGAIKCLNGLRVISMIWIIWGHTYNYIGEQSYFLLIQNPLDLLDIQKERIDPQIIINALYGVDTFFLISAMLITLTLMRFLKKNGMPRWHFWLLMYIERYLRLIPPYIMIFLLYVYVVPYVGQGPLWTAENFPMKNDDCKNYWWAYFILVNNFVPNGKGTVCLGYYWYVSNDFQLFLISPLLIVPLYYYPVIGSFILFGTLLASSFILGFNIANTYKVGQILVTLQEIWADTYIKPYCRAGPYVMGIILGYILFKTEKKKIHIPPLLHLLGWAIAIIFMVTSILGNWRNHDENGTPMSPGVYTTYFVLSRIAWPMAICWIIFSCYKGFAPLIDSILSWNGFTFFAHTSYTTYLIHPMIMVYYMFAQQHLFYATDITLLYIFFGHLVFSLILGFVAHLVFERTFGVLLGLILPKRQR